MRILYIAKHNSGGNDDEGAIAAALESLGCEVTYLMETDVTGIPNTDRWDVVLCHKWGQFDVQAVFKIPIVSWYFDLVEWDDPTLAFRNQQRRHHMKLSHDFHHTIFCTDGDWVDKSSDKHVWLPQGADQRKIEDPTYYFANNYTRGLLLTASTNGGKQRDEFMKWVLGKYSKQTTHYSNGMYGLALAKEIGSHSVCVAPSHPTTDRYWSNRVYLTMGYSGFLLHPYCDRLANTHVDGEHLRYYRSEAELVSLIDYYIGCPERVASIPEAGYNLTVGGHTYLHRCEQLLSVLESRGIKRG